MSFKLRESNKPLRRIRKICPDIRPSDLDGASEEEMNDLLSLLSRVKVARHGVLDNSSWMDTVPQNPYNTTVLVKPKGWYGGSGYDDPRWKNFPGAGDTHISDDKFEKNKQTRGRATDEDFTPDIRKRKINEKLRADSVPTDEYQWIVSVQLKDWEDAEKVKKDMSAFGRDADMHGRTIEVAVDDYENATRIQRRVPSSMVSRRRRGT